jgi:hypothetical protein
MFDMFKGGKSDPLTLWVVDQERQKEERKKKIEELIKTVRKVYRTLKDDEELNLWEYAERAGLTPLSEEEINYIIKRVEN